MMCIICRELPLYFSAYMAGGSSPSTSSAPTIYQLSSLPPPSTLSDVAIDSDLLKPPGETFWFNFCGFSLSWELNRIFGKI